MGKGYWFFNTLENLFSVIFKTINHAMKLLRLCYWYNFFSQCKNCQSQSQILVTYCQFLSDWKWMDSPLWIYGSITFMDQPLWHCYKADRNFPKRILVKTWISFSYMRWLKNGNSFDIDGLLLKKNVIQMNHNSLYC